MTMDAETLEVLMNAIRSAWERPLSDYEDDQWQRMLRPDPSRSLDPDLVGQTLTVIRAHPAFEHARPDVVAFRGHYDELVQLSKPATPDPADKPSTVEQAMVHLDEARALLMNDLGSSDEAAKPAAEQLL